MVNETQLLAVVAALFGILVTVLSWAGVRIFEKIDRVGDQISEGNKDLRDRLERITSELHDRVTKLDRRITRIETRCEIEHPGDD